MDAREILERVKTGALSVEEAEGYFRRQPFGNMIMQSWIRIGRCAAVFRK